MIDILPVHVLRINIKNYIPSMARSQTRRDLWHYRSTILLTCTAKMKTCKMQNAKCNNKMDEE